MRKHGGRNDALSVVDAKFVEMYKMSFFLLYNTTSN